MNHDAKYWLEDSDQARFKKNITYTHQKIFQINLVIIISIDHPCPPFPNFPRIRIELCARFSQYSSCPSSIFKIHQDRIASRVWNAEWTEGPTPFYILLSDIFRGQPPAAYGNYDRVYLNAGVWRQPEAIISNNVGFISCST
jgi:hypothetical protein